MDLRPTPKEWSGGIFHRRSLHFNITIPNVLLMLCDQLSPRVRNFPKCALSYAIYLSIRLPKFPSCSPKMFPIAPQFYPIWFAQSSTLMYINWKGTLNSGTFVSILHWGPESCFYWEVPNVPKNLVMGRSMWLLPQKKFKKWNVWETHELINMNHTFCWVLLALLTKARILCLDLV
jgi:hypothetical protein